MQVSIQTQRRKRPQNLNQSLPQVQQEDEKEKQRKLKKLTMINRQLIETLKRQNDELTKKINKQKIKVGRSVERAQSPSRNVDKEKRELANVYKQIEMYKTVLKDLKAKEISIQSADKLNNLQNRIKFEDMNIEKLQKQLKYVKGIKQQQEKQLHLYQNNDVKANVGDLEQELKQLKEKLKQAKKITKKKEEISMKQHAYFMELEKITRKQNDQYYPGNPSVPNKAKKQVNPNPAQQQPFTEKQIQTLKNQLNELKKSHQQYNKKIQNLNRMRNKQLKSCEDNEDLVKQKQRKLQTLKSKLTQLTKLMSADQEQKIAMVLNVAEQKGSRPKNNDEDRQVKKWAIPNGYIQECGKILPDSTFFSDKSQLRKSKKTKVSKIRVWFTSGNVPSICQFYYKNQQSRQLQGVLAYSLSDLQDLDDRVIQYKQGDYLYKIQGKIHEGFVIGLTFTSKFGKKQNLNFQASGEYFKLQPRPNQIPTCMFGASGRDYNDQLRMCHLGCEFVSDW